MDIHRAAYRWTSEELATAWRRHRDSELSPSIARLVGAFALLLSALVLWAVLYAKSNGSWSSDDSPLAALVVPAFALYWTVLRNPLLAWQAGRGFKKRPDADQLFEWEISAKEVKYFQRGLFYTARAWKSFVKVAEAEDGFLLYAQESIFLWLPARAFESPEAVAQVRAFIQTSGIPYKKTTP